MFLKCVLVQKVVFFNINALKHFHVWLTVKINF